jgi:hypothetical protein
LSKWIHQRLAKLQDISEIAPELSLILTAIEDMPAWLSKEVSPDISTYLFARYQSAPKIKDKMRLLKSCSIGLHSAALDSSQAANQAVASLDAECLEEFLELVSKYKNQPDDWWKTLFNQIVNNILTTARTTPSEQWAQKFAVIWKHAEVQSSEAAIKSLLTSVLSVPQINALAYWEDSVVNLSRSEKYKQKVVELIKAMLEAETSLENKNKIFEFYKKIALTAGEKNSDLGGYLLGFLEKSNVNSIKFGIAQLDFAKEMLADLFPARVEQYFLKLCEESVDVVSSKREGVLALLKYQDSWNTEAITLLIKVLKKLIASSNEVHLGLASLILEQLQGTSIKKVPAEVIKDFSKAIQVIQIQKHKDVMIKLLSEK